MNITPMGARFIGRIITGDPELGGGIIAMESKDEIKTRLGRSTDSGDPVALTFLRVTAPTSKGGRRGPQMSIA